MKGNLVSDKAQRNNADGNNCENFKLVLQTILPYPL